VENQPRVSDRQAEAQCASAAIVNYNARDHLVACVRSLRREGVGEIVVADNSSRDGSEAALARSDSEARWLPTGANLGFGAAANRAVAATTGPYVLVLNPDTVIHPGTIAALTAALDAEPRLAAVGPQMDNPDGSVYPSARRFPDLVTATGHAFVGLIRPDNRFTRRYRMLDTDPDRAAAAAGGTSPVDWVSGAAMMVRRSAFEAVGGFDPSYFMYVEDVDLCWRWRQAQWLVGYTPAGRVTHAVGASSRQVPYRMIAAHHRSLLRFAVRTTTGAQRLLLPAVAVGLAVRTVAAWVTHRFA